MRAIVTAAALLLVVAGCSSRSAAAPRPLSATDRSVCAGQHSELENVRQAFGAGAVDESTALGFSSYSVTYLIEGTNQAEDQDLKLLLAQATDKVGAVNKAAQASGGAAISGHVVGAASAALKAIDDWCTKRTS